MELSGKVLVFAFSFGMVLSKSLKEDFVESQWQEFKATFGRTFGFSEESLRKEIFRKNLEEITEHNKRFDAGETTWSMGVNQFTDMTEEEFESYLGFDAQREELFEPFDDSLFNNSYPESFSWLEKGGVTSVKTQGKCQGSWAFAAVGAMEGHHFAESGKLEVLSEQQFIDCSKKTKGCKDGQYQAEAFVHGAWVGAALEKDYPYQESDGYECRISGKNIVYKPKGYRRIGNRKEETLMATIANHSPVSVRMDFSKLRNYKSGIFDTDSSCRGSNHNTLVVAYGTEDGRDYFLIKNSWGTEWGENGYLRVVRGKGICNLVTYPVFPY